MRTAVGCFLLLLLAGAVAHATSDPSEVQRVATLTVENDIAVQGAAVAAVDSTGYRGDVSSAAGFADSTLARAMAPGIAVRAGTFGEMLVAAVTLQLVDELLLPQLDESIPSRLLPGGLSYINPSFAGQPLTLRMLLTHTSSLQDVSRFDASPSLVAAGSSATAYREAATAYFTTSASGTTAVRSDIWTTNEPGETATYLYARSNVALLGYILEIIVAENPTLTTVGTVGGLLQARIFNVLGMSNTYFALPNGDVPRVQSELTNLQGGKQTEGSATQILSMYVADYMVLTSATDLVRFFNSLFVQTTGALRSIGTTMLGSFIELVAVDDTRGGVTHQGFGLVRYSVATLCSSWTANSGSGLSCPYSDSRIVYGYGDVFDEATTQVLCQDDPLLVAATSTTGTTTTTTVTNPRVCVATTFTRSFSTTNAVELSRGQGLAAESFQQLQSTAYNTVDSVITADDQERGSTFAGLVALFVMLLILAVVLFTYILEFVVRPIAVAGPVTGQAYPRLEDFDAVDEASPLRDGP